MSRPKAHKVQRIELEMKDLEAILDRAESGPLNDADRETLRAAFETLFAVTNELDTKGTSIRRLRKLLFGSGSEKLAEILGETPTCAESQSEPDSVQGGVDPEEAAAQPVKKKRKGHGRNGAAAYRGAAKVQVPHESLSSGGRCPECNQGKVYRANPPAVIVRVTGQAPIDATVYQLKRLRCNLCGKVFTARPPPGVGSQKYDEKASSMIALLKYGSGLPFYRLEGLQAGLGIPLPSATQWEIVDESAARIEPAYGELLHQAAQGEVLHNDDTPAKILDLMGKRRDRLVSLPGSPDRTGTFTSGIVSRCGEHTIALFFTGPEHAGENLEKVLARRSSELAAPIQMCDALSRNVSGAFATLVGNCLSHGRRRFVDVVESFPEECRFVLEVLRDVYRNDAKSREQKMSAKERLALHKDESGPRMQTLKEWMKLQLAERKVEPNSSLGDAIQYMQNHWEKLTLFLRKAGAPLDNNICERALKKAILQRKNSMFYKTANGARVGDMYMSLIHTAELCDVNPFDYLVALQRHREEMVKCPGDWMPWSYQEACSRLLGEEEAPQPA